jgi:aryl-alcohol dehydrogenase-like predicted oxidoreductase
MDWDRIGSVTLSPTATVRRVGFGGAWLTGPGTYGPPPDVDIARGIVRRAVECGIQLIDTADSYGPETSERLIADALYPYTDDVVISTKGGRLALGPGKWQPNGLPEHLTAACEGSLRRLRLDAIELYQLNQIDPDVPVEESLGALLELREAGKIRNIGLCNVTAAELRRCQAIGPIASVQDRYDLLHRDTDAVINACADDGIAFLPWAPPANDLAVEPGSALAHVASEHAATPAQVALAWLLARSRNIVPLPGTTNPDWFEEDLAALDLELTDAQVKQLTAGR